MELNDLPVIDWELATKVAGSQKALASDILDMLMRNLQTDITTIQQLYQTEHHLELLRHVHKLHGALCYCGVPRLKAVIEGIETSLKKNIMVDLPTLFTQLDAETALLVQQYRSLPTGSILY